MICNVAFVCDHNLYDWYTKIYPYEHTISYSQRIRNMLYDSQIMYTYHETYHRSMINLIRIEKQFPGGKNPCQSRYESYLNIECVKELKKKLT